MVDPQTTVCCSSSAPGKARGKHGDYIYVRAESGLIALFSPGVKVVCVSRRCGLPRRANSRSDGWKHNAPTEWSMYNGEVPPGSVEIGPYSPIFLEIGSEPLGPDAQPSNMAENMPAGEPATTM